MDFIEAQSPDYLSSGVDLIAKLLKKTDQENSGGSWALYINDRRWDNLKAKIKPRSKVLLVKKLTQLPEIQIVHQEGGWLALNKPANLPTQSTLKAFEDNLYQRVRYYFLIEKEFPKGLPYVGLHHRLDRGTSGLVLMTLKRSYNKAFSELFKNRKIQKNYLCYTEPGKMAPPSYWKQEDFLKRGNTKRKKFYFQVSEAGDKAIAEFELVERVEGKYNLIACRPKTGRTHQLRVQLSHKGYPILGDPVYGRKKSASRLMLHAAGLKFKIQDQDFHLQCPPCWQVLENLT